MSNGERRDVRPQAPRDGRGDAATYPMRVVTRLTGLTADTIRIWERRYGAVRPERTQGNVRRYSSTEIRRLTLLREAIARGHSIGEIGALPDDQLERLAGGGEPGATAAAPVRSRWWPIIEAYIEAVERYDLRRADEILTRTAVLTSPRELALEFVAPLLREVGERWEHGEMSIAQEHVISGQAKSLLGTMLRAGGGDPGAPRIVLAAAEGQQHDLGALIGGVLCATRGVVPIHLGPDVPWSELGGAMRRADADVLLLAFSCDLDRETERRCTAELRKLVGDVEVWIGSPADHPMAHAVKQVRAFHEFEQLDAELAHRFSRAQP